MRDRSDRPPRSQSGGASPPLPRLLAGAAAAYAGAQHYLEDYWSSPASRCGVGSPNWKSRPGPGQQDPNLPPTSQSRRCRRRAVPPLRASSACSANVERHRAGLCSCSTIFMRPTRAACYCYATSPRMQRTVAAADSTGRTATASCPPIHWPRTLAAAAPPRRGRPHRADGLDDAGVRGLWRQM